MLRARDTDTIGISILGSGSAGNAVLLTADGAGLLIDAGFSSRNLVERINRVGFDPARIKAVLVTHEHGDHIRGLRVFCGKHSLPAYMSEGTMLNWRERDSFKAELKCFQAGAAFEIDGFGIRSFSIPHDTADPVAYIIERQEVRIGIATDMGHLTTLAEARLRDCDALILEANHDPDMVRNSPRPLALKRRILGTVGHLSNDSAMSAIDRLLTPRCRHLFLAHLSAECNDRGLVEKMTRDKLAVMERDDIVLCLAEQDNPTPPVWVGRRGPT